MNLYEIDFEIMNCLDEETGEIIDTEKLDTLQMERDRKIDNIGLWIKDLDAEAEAIKAEQLKLADRMAAAERKATKLRQYLTHFLDGEKFKTPRLAISFRKSTQVCVDDATALPEDYLKYAEPTVDKTKVKNALKDGVLLNGVRLIERKNIQIK